MKLRPGSVPWFLRHELRLLWIGAFTATPKGGNGRQVNKLALGTLGGVWLLMHGLAYMLLLPLEGGGGGAYPPAAMWGVTLAVLVVFMFMVSNGLKASVEALFERGDLDLLLSSPLPSLSIFSARLAGVALYCTVLYLFFLVPFAHAGLIQGKFHLLGIYPAVLGMGAAASSIAMLLTLGLVRLLGAARTRVLAQVLGALAGALIFLSSQAFPLIARQDAAQGWMSQAMAPGGLLAPGSAVWLPAKAVLGDSALLLWFGLVAAVVLFLTIRLTHRFFVRGLQLAASSSRVARRAGKGQPYRFRSGLFEVTVLKEWKLIRRDPHLISQLLMQLLYLLPMLFLLFTKPDHALPGLSAGLVLLSSSIAGSLAWLTVFAEDAPDLLLSSPAHRRVLRLAKLAAAAMPPLLLAALPLLWLLLRHPMGGVLLSFPVVAAILSAVQIVQWHGRPAARSDFGRRGASNWLGNLAETLNSMGWGALAYVLVLIGSGAEVSDTALLAGMCAFALVLALPAAAWATRRRPP